jgi:hypothetical protein
MLIMLFRHIAKMLIVLFRHIGKMLIIIIFFRHNPEWSAHPYEPDEGDERKFHLSNDRRGSQGGIRKQVRLTKQILICLF